MGGDGPTTFDRVVQFCDGWMPIARGGLPAGLEEKMKDLRARASAAGRDPDAISVSVSACPPTAEAIDECERLVLSASSSASLLPRRTRCGPPWTSAPNSFDSHEHGK